MPLARCEKSLRHLTTVPCPPAFAGKTASYPQIEGRFTVLAEENGPSVSHRDPFPGAC